MLLLSGRGEKLKFEESPGDVSWDFASVFINCFTCIDESAGVVFSHTSLRVFNGGLGLKWIAMTWIPRSSCQIYLMKVVMGP